MLFVQLFPVMLDVWFASDEGRAPGHAGHSRTFANRHVFLKTTPGYAGRSKIHPAQDSDSSSVPGHADRSKIVNFIKRDDDLISQP